MYLSACYIRNALWGGCCLVLTNTSDVILLLNVELKYYRDFLKQSRVYLPEKSTRIFEKPEERQNGISFIKSALTYHLPQHLPFQHHRIRNKLLSNLQRQYNHFINSFIDFGFIICEFFFSTFYSIINQITTTLFFNNIYISIVGRKVWL